MLRRISVVSLVIFIISTYIELQASLPFKHTEKGTFSIYFMDEKVGFEEYSWTESERGFELSVEGRMTKPLRLEIERMTIRLDKSFIPTYFYLKGTMSGVAQEISSVISEGQVQNRIKVSGQDQRSTIKIRRDAFLLPNPIFSAYLAITKKFRCMQGDPLDLSAYIIPQTEIPFSLLPHEEEACVLLMQLGASQIELRTNESGTLQSVYIPSQKLRVVLDQ